MDKNIKSELMYRFSDYIGAYSVMDAVPAGMIQTHQVKTDKNLYGLIVGAESAIKAANDTIKADGKGYSYSFV